MTSATKFQKDYASELYTMYFTSGQTQGDMTEKEDAFFHIFTAASLNHKRARFFLAIILENGLLPNRETILLATNEGNKYHFLRRLVDPEVSILFKYLT